MKIKNKTKFLILFLCIAVSLALMACGRNSDEGGNKEEFDVSQKYSNFAGTYYRYEYLNPTSGLSYKQPNENTQTTKFVCDYFIIKPDGSYDGKSNKKTDNLTTIIDISGLIETIVEKDEKVNFSYSGKFCIKTEKNQTITSDAEIIDGIISYKDLNNDWFIYKKSESILTSDEAVDEKLKIIIENGISIQLFNNKYSVVKTEISGVNKIIIPATFNSIAIEEICDEAFKYNIEGIDEIEISEGIKTIGKSAFENTPFRKIIIPNTVHTIKSEAFSYSKVEEINFSDSVINLDTENLFYRSAIKKVKLPIGLKVIGDSSFEASKLEEIELHEGLSEIGIKAFAYTNLKFIAIPSSVIELKESAFGWCGDLTKVTINDNSKLQNIGSWAFAPAYEREYVLQYIDIPASVQKIDEYAFGHMGKRGMVANVKASSQILHNDSFKQSFAIIVPDEAKEEYVGWNTTVYSDVNADGEFIIKDNKLLRYFGGNTTINFPASIRSVGKEAFMLTPFWASLEEDTIVYLNGWALGVKDEDKKYNPITGEYSLKGIINPNFEFSEGTVGVAEGFLNYCKEIMTIDFCDTIKWIGEESFQGSENLTSVTFGAGLIYIGRYSFVSCSKLATVNYVGSELQWSNVFKGDDNILSLPINKNYIRT